MTAKVLEKKFVVPFILITTLFALWGFANDITNPMVAVFQTVRKFRLPKPLSYSSLSTAVTVRWRFPPHCLPAVIAIKRGYY